jgi:hypothetical protein
MRREALLLDEIISAAQRATDIATRHGVDDWAASPDARDALLWNLTVIGEAVSQPWFRVVPAEGPGDVAGCSGALLGPEAPTPFDSGGPRVFRLKPQLAALTSESTVGSCPCVWIEAWTLSIEE